MPGRVEAERARDRFGRRVSGRLELAGGGVDGETGDAVVPAVADIEEFRRRGQVYLRAGVAFRIAVGQAPHALHEGERPGSGVQAIDADTTALLLGKIDKVETGVEAVVPRANHIGLRDAEL